MAGYKGMGRYSIDLKREAIRRFYEEGQTRAQITAALGIRDREAVKKWLRRYRREGEAAWTAPLGRPRQAESVEAEVARLRLEVELLKKVHSELRPAWLAKRNIG